MSMGREGGTQVPYQRERDGSPYHVTYPTMHLMLPDACENITFPKLRLRVVKIASGCGQ